MHTHTHARVDRCEQADPLFYCLISEAYHRLMRVCVRAQNHCTVGAMHTTPAGGWANFQSAAAAARARAPQVSRRYVHRGVRVILVVWLHTRASDMTHTRPHSTRHCHHPSSQHVCAASDATLNANKRAAVHTHTHTHWLPSRKAPVSHTKHLNVRACAHCEL